MTTTTPYPFQTDALNAIETFNGRSILTLSMGLGKSPVALWYLQKHPELWPGIIVCPAYLKQKWQREVAKHINMPATILTGRTPKKVAKSNIYIINYDITGPSRKDDGTMFPGWLGYIKDRIKPKTLIVDESQNLSASAKWTDHIKEVSLDTPSVLALSGTPFWNYPIGMFPTLNIVRPDLWPSFQKFAWRHCDPKKIRGSWVYKGAVQMRELRQRMLKTCMFRRRKQDVLPDLPPKVRTVVPMDITDRKGYVQEVRKFLTFESGSDKRAETLRHLGELKQFAAISKLPAVFDWIDDFLIQDGGKLLMFGWHREIVEALHERYKDISVLIYGAVSSKHRDSAERMFQTNDKTRILFGNMKACGTGLDLTAAHTVAFCEIAWNPGTHIQAEDRCYGRLNDLHGCNVFYLVAADTIESFLCDLNQRKQGMIEELLDGTIGVEGFDIYDQVLEHLKISNVFSAKRSPF